MLDVVVALPEDREAACRFYAEVCAFQARQVYGPRWQYGVYPADADLDRRIAAGELLLGFLGGRVAAAMVMARGEDPIYRDVPWGFAAAEDQVCVLHLLAVHPDFRGRHLAETMLDELIRRGRAEGLAAVHLDVILGNPPAEQLYRKKGFRFAAVWYPDTGDVVVRLYEYPL